MIVYNNFLILCNIISVGIYKKKRQFFHETMKKGNLNHLIQNFSTHSCITLVVISARSQLINEW